MNNSVDTLSLASLALALTPVSAVLFFAVGLVSLLGISALVQTKN